MGGGGATEQEQEEEGQERPGLLLPVTRCSSTGRAQNDRSPTPSAPEDRGLLRGPEGRAPPGGEWAPQLICTPFATTKRKCNDKSPRG